MGTWIGGEFEGVKPPLLMQYFRLEELPPQNVMEQLIGVIEPVPMYWLFLGIPLLLLTGAPLAHNWYYGVVASGLRNRLREGGC